MCLYASHKALASFGDEYLKLLAHLYSIESLVPQNLFEG